MFGYVGGPQEEVSIVFNFVCILSLANALERFCKDSQQNHVPLHSTAETASVGVGCCWMMLAVSQSVRSQHHPFVAKWNPKLFISMAFSVSLIPSFLL